MEDAASIGALVATCPPLDVNSVYAYLLLCEHFSGSCAVAVGEERVVGFVSGYRPPNRSSTLFIWQVAVHASVRGDGLASRMIRAILARESCDGVRFVEATVNPSNDASAAMFTSLARRLGCPVTRAPLFGAELFRSGGASGAHESEDLLRLGPISHSAIDADRSQRES